MITLAVDASTYVGTTAVLRDGKILADADAVMRGRESEALMPAVVATLSRASVSVRDLSRVVCGAGPGSFTSLRIAASIAKGIAAGVGCPLYAISSLALLAAGDGAPRPGRFLAALDALRGEAYVGGFSVEGSGEIVVIMPPSLVRQQDVATVAKTLGAVTIGPGQEIDRAPKARGVMALEGIIEASGPVDLGGWEPAYGRNAEAQVRWEAAHGQPLPLGGSSP
ncbi:MAG TPA: tRNA (adenosine(37)-N6)-threonylcarbamoyltransferase complex dimerization subunit type 1 TsaB [Gemmatimonadaceae bacterium]|nr:tRNA (adenosine(37)-N6)-threonylcarbamoyltransferase complex dimerization subunit type 1 TsaB [Gemmatimonadaceae bacterium]